MVEIDRKVLQYLRDHAVDLKAFVGKPGGVIDAQELTQIEGQLATDGVLTAEAQSVMTKLRALAKEPSVLIPMDAAFSTSWKARVGGPLLSSDIERLRQVISVDVEVGGGVMRITPEDVRELAAEPKNRDLVQRLVAADGQSIHEDGLRLDVSALPARDGPFGQDDLDDLRILCGVTPRGEWLDVHDYQKTRALLERWGLSPNKRQLLERMELASVDQRTIGGVRIDLLTPTDRELRALSARHRIDWSRQDLMGQLAALPLTEAERGIVRRLAQSHGQKVQLPGQAQNTLDVSLHPDEWDALIQRFGASVLGIDDGNFDAHDLEALQGAMALAETPKWERELLVTRLLATEGKEVILETHDVRIAVKTLSVEDLRVVRDIFGVDLADGKLELKDVLDVMTQVQNGGIPRGLSNSLVTLSQGGRLSGPEAETFLEQASRRLDVLLATSQDPGLREQATALRQRLSVLGTAPFDPHDDNDRAQLDLLKRILTAPAQRQDAWGQALIMRLNGAHGQQVALPDGKSIKVDLNGRVDFLDAEQAMHDRLVAASRLGRDFAFSYEGGRYIVTVHSENELQGDSKTFTAQLRDDMKGGSVAMRWDFGVPVHPDVWLKLYTGIGAAYEQNKAASGDTVHHLAVEGAGGFDVKFFLQRRLGMTLDIEGHAKARAHVNVSERGLEEATKTTEKTFDELQREVSRLMTDYKLDLDQIMAQSAGALGDEAVRIATRRIEERLPDLEPIAIRWITVSQLGDADAEAREGAAFRRVLREIDAAIRQDARPEVARHYNDMLIRVGERSETLAGDVGALAHNAARDIWRAVVPAFSFGYGVTVGGSATWRARLPIITGSVGALMFTPMAQVYTEVPIAALSKDDQPFLTGQRPIAPRVGARAEVGLMFQPRGSPLYTYAALGADKSVQVGGGRVSQEPLVIYGHGGLGFRW